MTDVKRDRPAVSVVLTTYNRSALIPDAIESVLRQTWTDYELIVVDDGSTDNTREHLQSYMDRIRYSYQPNKGVSAARNSGAGVARGMWLAFLDSDDAWEPTKLERQLAASSAMGEEFGACFTNCRYKGNRDLNSTLFQMAGLVTEGGFGAISNPVRYIMSQTYGLCIQSALVLKSVFERAGGFDEGLVIAEDRELIFRLSFLTKFAYVAEPLVNIDRTPGAPRLTDFCSRRDDHVYVWNERLLKSMLACPDFTDLEVRELIREELVGLYYDWAAARIGDLDVKGSMRNLHRLREMGQSRRRIFSTLLARGGEKLSRIRGTRG